MLRDLHVISGDHDDDDHMASRMTLANSNKNIMSSMDVRDDDEEEVQRERYRTMMVDYACFLPFSL